MSLVQADGNSWKGRAKHITSLLYSTKHVRSPDWPGNHRLHTADKKREMPRNKITLWFHLLIIIFVLRILLTLFIPLYYFVLNPAGKTRDTLRDSWKLCTATLPWSKIILLRYLPRLQDPSLCQPPTLLLMGYKIWEVLYFAHRISGKACKGNQRGPSA